MLYSDYLKLQSVRASQFNQSRSSEDGTGQFNQSRSSEDGMGALVVSYWCNKRRNRHSYALECRWTKCNSCRSRWSMPSWWLYLRPLWDEHRLTSQGREYHICEAGHMTLPFLSPHLLGNETRPVQDYCRNRPYFPQWLPTRTCFFCPRLKGSDNFGILGKVKT